MRNLFRFVGLRHLRMRPLRTLLTMLGVTLGIALYIAIAVINRSTLASFKESVDAVAGRATLVISAGEAGFPEGISEKARAVTGVKHAVPMVQSRAYFAGAKGESETLMVLGVDLLKEQAVRTYKTTDERIMDDPLVFMNQPDSIIITHAFAREHGLGMDSKIELATARGTRRFTVRGMLSPEGPAKAFGGAVAIMDIDGAQVSFGKQGRLDRVDIVTEGGVDAVAASLRAQLGPGYAVERPESQSEHMERMVKSFQEILVFFSLLALLVSVFLILNAMSIAVAERKREIGTLRAVGATRAGILALFLSEAVFMGALGAFAGGWMGRALASVMLKTVTHSLSTQHLANMDVARLDFTLGDVGRGVIVGAISCLVAALWPASRATAVRPVEAMRRADLGEEAARTGLLRLAPYLGAALCVYLWFSARYEIGKGISAVVQFNQISGILGATLLGPWIVGMLLRAFRPVLAPVGGIISRLAEGNLARNPKRTGSNVMALMVGLMLVVMVGTVNQSFKKTIGRLFDRMLSADLLISSSGRVASLQAQPLHEDLAAEIARIPGVDRGVSGRAVSGMRFIHITYQGEELGLKAYDEPDPVTRHWWFDVEDRPTDPAMRELFEGAEPNVFVSSSFAAYFKKKSGDVIELPTPSGAFRARISGIVADYAAAHGVIYLRRVDYKRYWRDPLISVFAVKAAAGTSPLALRRRIDSALGRSRNITVVSNEDFKREILALTDQSFAYTRAIEAAALLIALLGLLNTLLISVMERMREFGMLRAVGMSRGQLSAMILQESALQGGLCAVAAVAMGSAAAYLWVRYALTSIMGWVVHYYFPWRSVATTLVTGLLVALAAGVYPSYRAAKLEIREALEYE